MIRTRLFSTKTENLLNQYTRRNTETEDNYAYDNALIYEREFLDSIRAFRVLASHSYRDQLEEQDINTYSGEFTSNEITNKERSATKERRQTAVFQADYVQSLFWGKIEVGLKSIFRSFDNDYLFEVFDDTHSKLGESGRCQ